MELNLTFRNAEQETFYWSRKRNNRFGGGFGNGKTYAACMRALTMLMTFPNYRVAMCRLVYKNLRSSTMQTFFKVCPEGFILTHDENFGLTILINGSRIYWLHLDQMDEATAKGFEINALIIDQAEEVDEPIFLLMDARVGRWEKAVVPDYLLEQYPNWPRHKKWGYPLVPNYVDILDNPSDDEFHWVSRYYDDDSAERKPHKTHFSIVRQTDDDLNDAATIEQILTRDQSWIDKYYLGKKVISGGAVHVISAESKIDPDLLTPEDWAALLILIRDKAALYRVLDHGETSPTCCLWVACVNNVHIFFGEYYQPNDVISSHRQNIHDISNILCRDNSEDERDLNFTDIADPQIFKRTSQKQGGFWTTAMEYADEEEISAPPIHWQPGDNNELATRNRINELLKPIPRFFHPITKISPAPGIYFIKSSTRWPYGCHQALIETARQKKLLLGEVNGKKFYSEDRDETVPDHAYDPVRYYVASHGSGKAMSSRTPPRRSFEYYNRIWKMRNRPHFVQG